MTPRRVLLSVLVSVLLVAPTFSRAEDRYVPKDYGSIQEAIDASSQGDRILIAPGTYYESDWIWADKSLTLMSESGLRDVDLVCSIDVDPYLDEGSNSYFRMNGITLWGEVDVEGFTPSASFTDCGFEYEGTILQGGTYGNFQACTWNRRGLFIFNGAAEIDTCEFTNGAYLSAGYSWNGYSAVFSSRFLGGGGVYSDGAGCWMDSCEIRDGGIIGGNYEMLELYGCTFMGGAAVATNYAHMQECTFRGPGATAIQGDVLLERSTVSGYDVGLLLGESQGCSINNSVFAGNGTGIRLANGSFGDISSSTLSGNRVGISADYSTDAYLESCIAWGNGKDVVSPTAPPGVHARASLVGKWDGWIGTDGPQPILMANPRFLRSASHGRDGIFGTPDDELGDLRLQSTSPCIDRGYGVVGGTDLSGMPRTNGQRVDIGAYEYRPLPLMLSLITPDACLIGRIQNVMIYGAGFKRGCTVHYGAAAFTPVFLSEASLRITLSTADTSNAGVVNILVVNPSGEVSSSLPFTVNNPKPSLEALSPPAVDHGSGDFLLYVSGARIAPTATVFWNGAPRPTVYVPATGETYAKISAADVAVTGRVAVTIANPGPGGGVSNVKTFTIR